jgi:hypothetical protein
VGGGASSGGQRAGGAIFFWTVGGLQLKPPKTTELHTRIPNGPQKQEATDRTSKWAQKQRASSTGLNTIEIRDFPELGLFNQLIACSKEAHGVRVQTGVRFQRRGFRSPIRARSRESESKEEPDPGAKAGSRQAPLPGLSLAPRTALSALRAPCCTGGVASTVPLRQFFRMASANAVAAPLPRRCRAAAAPLPMRCGRLRFGGHRC